MTASSFWILAGSRSLKAESKRLAKSRLDLSAAAEAAGDSAEWPRVGSLQPAKFSAISASSSHRISAAALSARAFSIAFIS
jgi:hypothetical protein